MTRLLLTAALTLAASGCVSTSAEMNRIQRDVDRSVREDGRASVGDGTSISLGRVSMATTRLLGGLFAPGTTRPYRRLSHHVRRVQFGQFPVTGAVDGRTLRRPAILDRYERGGWLTLAAVRDSSGAVWVLYRERERDQTVTDILTVALSAEDLAVARLSGNLSALVLDAVALAQTDVLGATLAQTGLLGASKAVATDDGADADPPRGSRPVEDG